MKHCPDPKSENIYSFSEEGLLINGVPLDCEAIVQAAKDRLADQKSVPTTPDLKHEIYKKAVFGKLEAKDAHKYPAVYCIEKVKNQINKLNEDLYLKAQLDFLQLSFAENLSLLNTMGYQEISFTIEKTQGEKPAGKLMVERNSPFTGRPEKSLADAKVGPTYPSMKGIKVAMEEALMHFCDKAREVVSGEISGSSQISIKTDGSSVVFETQTHSTIGSLFPPEKTEQICDVGLVLSFCEEKHSKVVTSTHVKNKEADTQSAPVSARRWGKAFSMSP